ncbi:transmembrane protein, putative [Medicago truncatula]|uniref:Transmembrane protein, putative n=2 Tax=Medicago truncatula TaxID=3880 RepID=A0A072VJW4_MEDTR|nr:transmembrane protein, putative [Medicago truncatula]
MDDALRMEESALFMVSSSILSNATFDELGIKKCIRHEWGAFGLAKIEWFSLTIACIIGLFVIALGACVRPQPIPYLIHSKLAQSRPQPQSRTIPPLFLSQPQSIPSQPGQAQSMFRSISQFQHSQPQLQSTQSHLRPQSTQSHPPLTQLEPSQPQPRSRSQSTQPHPQSTQPQRSQPLPRPQSNPISPSIHSTSTKSTSTAASIHPISPSTHSTSTKST